VNKSKDCLEKARSIFDNLPENDCFVEKARLAYLYGKCMLQLRYNKEALMYFKEAVKMALCDHTVSSHLVSKYIFCMKKRSLSWKVQKVSGDVIEVGFSDVDIDCDNLSNADLEKNARWIGDCLLEKNKFVQALEYYQAAISVGEDLRYQNKNDETLAACYHRKGACLLNVKRSEDALESFFKAKATWERSRVSAFDPRLGSTIKMIGKSFCALKKYHIALKYYEEGISRQKETAQQEETETLANLFNEIGFCYARLDMLDQAKTFLTRAKAIFETFDDLNSRIERKEVAEMLGDCKYQQGNYNKALEYYREALIIVCHDLHSKLTASLMELNRKIGICFFKLQMFYDAKISFRKAAFQFEPSQ